MAGETGSRPPGWGGRQLEGIFFLPTTTCTTSAYSETIPSAVPELGYTSWLEIRPQLMAAGYIEIQYVSSPVLILNTKKCIERWKKMFSIQVKTLIVLVTSW